MPNETSVASPSLWSPALVLVCVASFGAMVSFYLLLSVVPQFAASIGANGVAAGFTTGALMLATVGTELVTPQLTASFGRRVMFTTGLLLLGAPALALSASSAMPTIIAVCLVRGIGFAIIVVLGSALVAALVPSSRRAEGLGVYGVVVGVPAIVALPAGVWLADHVGYETVFIASAVSALIGIAALPGIGSGTRVAEQSEPSVGLVTVLRSRTLAGPAAIFSLSAMATGVVVTFLALALPKGSGNLVAVALLANAVASTVCRWLAGRYGHRIGSTALLVRSVLAAAFGTLLLAITASDVAVIGGMVLLGAGFGIAQNASIALMYDRAPASANESVSAVWNIAYDAGLGVGSTCFGVVAARTGYSAAFVVTAALMLVALLTQRRAPQP